MPKKIEFQVEVAGQTYSAYRIVSGTKAGKKQRIYLSDDISEIDQERYSPAKESIMELMAKSIAKSLIRKHLHP